ncbi:MAG: hypothetical protein M3Z96_00815, partial [Pseudomonadota bacterium]|nr:hypothetical protein [Pseudomonadota bacterium]
FAVYEGSLFAISLALASGVSDYAPVIVWRIFAINTAAFAALFLVHRLGVFAGLLAQEPRLPRANGALNARPPGSRFSRLFRAVFRLVLRRALLRRGSAAQVPQLQHAIPAKPEYSIEKRNNNSQKYNVVEQYNNSM